ncbi:hypothetical protein E2P86_12115 [Sphingobacterium psychroaquaticum]|uniref:hypothetical protein n=1 Tax=Sphingobacterium psychroaquaticum TaxID=561061 RepID=UPI0010694CB3|nr:hypothetical protein [Sphingobacterium psychroaquaticum]QBQ41859.1 hypothetical protein E2P86_12115 [Sphingobacterium psychroaquaticum]
MVSNPQIEKFFKEEIRHYQAKSFSFAFVQQHHLSLQELLTYSFHTDDQIAFRAAWLLEHVMLKEHQLLSTIYDDFIGLLPKQTNWSAIRSYTKLLMIATDKKTVKKSTPTQEEIIIETVFSWMIDPKCPVATRVNCMDVLYNLSSKHPWIKDELAAQIQYHLRNPSAALASRGNRVLKRIL